MTLTEKIQLAWKNRHQIPQIAEGFFNAYMSLNRDIQEQVKVRKEICESNVCGHYDAEGKGDNVILSGKPACDICGCNIPAKPACLSCTCSLIDIGETPLWSAVMTQEQEDDIRQTAADKRAKYEEHQRNKKNPQ